MQKIRQVLFTLFFLVVVILLAPSAMAYEQTQLNDCILSAKDNSAIKGASERSIESYCDCALNLIVDQGKDVRESGYECAIKSFG